MLEVSCWSTVYLQPTSTLFNCNIFNFISNSPWRMRELKPWKARGKHKSASVYDGGRGGGQRTRRRDGGKGVGLCLENPLPTQDPGKSPQEEETSLTFILVENH